MQRLRNDPPVSCSVTADLAKAEETIQRLQGDVTVTRSRRASQGRRVSTVDSKAPAPSDGDAASSTLDTTGDAVVDKAAVKAVTSPVRAASPAKSPMKSPVKSPLAAVSQSPVNQSPVNQSAGDDLAGAAIASADAGEAVASPMSAPLPPAGFATGTTLSRVD